MSVNVGVAVVGMGRWGKAWSSVLAHAPGVDLVTSPPSGERRDFRDTIRDEAADVIVITLPVALHLAATQLAASLGKPVLCEKPAVADRIELGALLSLERRSSTIRVGQNYRARRWAVSARDAIMEIGPLSSVAIEFAQPEFPVGGRETLRHPLLADMAIHHMDLLRWLTGQDATVVTARSFRVANTGYLGDSDVTGLLALHGGAPVTYSATWASGYAPTPWDGNWTFRGADGVVNVRNTVVTVDRGDGPAVTWSGADDEQANLACVWEDFRSVLEGRTPTHDAAVSVGEHARSLNLVFEMSVAAGVSAPHMQTTEK